MADNSYISLKNYYPTTVTVDDAEGNVVSLPIRVRRFTVDQMQAYQQQFHRFEHPAHERRIYRQPDGDEQARKTVTFGTITSEVYAIPDTEIQRRRLLAMTDEDRAAYERERADEEAFQAAFLIGAVRDYVTVAPDVVLQMEDDAGATQRVVSGADLVRVFGGQPMILGALARAVHTENMLTPEQKKRWRLPSSSTDGSTRPKVDGPRPGGTVPAAAPSGSAPIAPVSGRRATRRSGSPKT